MHFRWYSTLAWVLAWAAAAASPALAGTVRRPPANLPFTVTADSFDYEQARDIYTASGNVRVVQDGGGTLNADWMVLNYKTRVGVAVGNVVIRDAGDLVETDFARINLTTLEVLARDGRIDSEDPALVVEGGWLTKTGENAYGLERGLFTTCRCPPGRKRRPWEITTSEADVTVGGYATAKNVVFRTFGFPLLYAPYAFFPVKSERQSGLLVPTVARSSRSGTELEVPFFWAARDNLNILLRPELLSKRGVKTGADLEYVFGETGYGKGGFGLLFGDNQIKDDDPATRFSDNRYAFWLRHEQPLGSGARLGLDLKRVSDNQYVIDFDDFSTTERSARFLKSSAWLAKARDGLYGNVEVAMFDDLQSPNDLDRDKFFLQRLPDVRLSMLPRSFGLGALEASADLRYTYFYQRNHSSTLRGNAPAGGGGRFFDTGPDGLFNADEPDKTGRFPGARDPARDVNNDDGPGTRRGEKDGVFQEGELVADRGQRVDFYPKLTLPQRLGILETLSEIGYRETLYLADEAGTESRELFTARFDARTRFQREFQVGRLSLWHRVEPRVGFSVVSGEDQSQNPLFIPRSSVRTERQIDADPRLLLRNPSDRIEDERFLNFSVSNQLYAPALTAGKPPREVAELRIGSGYDFVEGRQSNVFVDARFRPNPAFSLTSEFGYDPQETRVDEVAASVAFKGGAPVGLPRSQTLRGNQAMLSYRFLRNGIDTFEKFLRQDEVFDNFTENFRRVDQLGLVANYVISRQFDFFASGYQSFEDSEVRGGGFGLNFFSSCGCWELSLRVDSTTRPEDTRFGVEFRLEGFGFGVQRSIDQGSRN